VRRDRAYRGGRCLHWVKVKTPNSPAMKRGRLVQMTERLQKITFGDMRDSGVHGIVVNCSDYRCAPRRPR
jgi:hypothetical protein